MNLASLIDTGEERELCKGWSATNKGAPGIVADAAEYRGADT
jgi:hypothetical protein